MEHSAHSGSNDSNVGGENSTSPRSGDIESLKRTHAQAFPGPNTLPQFETLFGSDGRAKFQKHLQDTGRYAIYLEYSPSLNRFSSLFLHASRFGGSREIRVPAPGRGKGAKKRIIGVWGLGEGHEDVEKEMGNRALGRIGVTAGEMDDDEGPSEVELAGKCTLVRLEMRDLTAEERYEKRRAEGRLGDKLRAEVRRSPLGSDVES